MKAALVSIIILTACVALVIKIIIWSVITITIKITWPICQAQLSDNCALYYKFISMQT